jgi:mono/diheme cytochrome c family protein
LFDGAPTKPTDEALDLVAYLDSLGRGAAIVGLSGPAPLPAMDPAEEKRRGMFCDCAIPRTPGPPLQLNTKMVPSEQTRFERRGAEVFARDCAGCHGGDGRGTGPAAIGLMPKPRDLTTGRFSDAGLSDVLWAGVTGSSMPGWHDLPANDLRALAAFVHSVGESPAADPPLTDDELKQARDLYTKNCLSCHGPDGNGNPTAATAVVPAPASFRRVRPTASYAVQVLTNGIPGTAMTPWREKLSEEDRYLLARYVRSFYAED